MELAQGVHFWRTVDGIAVLQAHYTADPKKRDPAWIDDARRGSTKEGWAQEMEIDWTVTVGVPWYPEFSAEMHVAKEPLTVLSRPVIAGWDYGLTPATVFCQTTAAGQILIHYPELQSWSSGITKHGALVKQAMASTFSGKDFYHYGDPAGNQRAQTDEKTCVQVLRETYGINVMSGPVAMAQRDLPMRKVMSTLVNGKPQLVIDPRNTWLIEALKGGYKRKQVNDQVLDVVDDNDYTHIVDAMGYAIAMLGYQGEPALQGSLPKLGGRK